MIHAHRRNGTRCGGPLYPTLSPDLHRCDECGLVGYPCSLTKRGRCHCIKCGLIRYGKHEAAPGSPCRTQPGRLAC